VVQPPRPKSPPRYPDLCGRRRLQLLNREIDFLKVSKPARCALPSLFSATLGGRAPASSTLLTCPPFKNTSRGFFFFKCRTSTAATCEMQLGNGRLVKVKRRG
jgi:hypothetical protein